MSRNGGVHALVGHIESMGYQGVSSLRRVALHTLSPRANSKHISWPHEKALTVAFLFSSLVMQQIEAFHQPTAPELQLRRSFPSGPREGVPRPQVDKQGEEAK